MSNFFFKDRDGQTPLPPEMQKGLIPKHIQTMGELDEYEEENIAEGLAWLESCTDDGLTYTFWCKLHKKLFANVWNWAGTVRKHELHNPYFMRPQEIWPAFKNLEDDLKHWLEKREFPFEKMAARFHERIETIHPFPNGNGRFGRILIEYFCKQQKQKTPTWGAKLKGDPKKRRESYIGALDRCRQEKNYDRLVEFLYA